MWTNICGGFTMCHLLSFVVFLMLWNKCTEAQILGGIQVGMWKTECPTRVYNRKKEGPWRVCAGDRCGMEGIQLRSVTCEDPSSHINMPKSYCNQNKQPADSQTCFKVCKRHQHEFFWNVGTWQHCLEQNNHSSLMRKKCEPHDPPTGFQTRVVQCSNKTNISMVVEDYVCLRFWSRPPVNQSCLISCPQDCVTSEFGSWSSCSRTCNNGTQIRVRSVLRVSRYGGEICPPLTEARVCPNLPPCPEDEATHKLKFGEWTVCEKAKVDSRSWSRKDKRHRRGRIMRERIGLMKRNVTCLSEDGRSVRESVVVAKTCAIPLDCVTTSWSDWSECSSSCGGGGVQRRSRGIKQLPQGEGARSCYALEESRSCQVQLHSIGLCLSYIWVSGAWDECKTMLNSTCGGGTQSRDVYCVQHDKSLRQQAYANFTMGGNNGAETWALMRPVESSHCDQGKKPGVWRECDVPCKYRCDVGQWSEWSECALASCPGDPHHPPSSPSSRRRSKKTKGFMRRMREVYNGYSAPEDCPHNLEVIPCSNARCFSWHIRETLPCQPNHGRCGNGTRIQIVECRDMWRRVVEDERCSSEDLTPRLKSCYLSCSDDCVVSEWGTWLPCQHPCKRGKKDSVQQSRHRYIITKPGPNGRRCPHADDLAQYKSCNQHHCSIFFWNAFGWSQCKPTGNPAMLYNQISLNGLLSNVDNTTSNMEYPVRMSLPTCGRGHQSRTVVCKKKESGRVRDKMCLGWNKPMSERPCRVGCNRDCVLSVWSAWSGCEEECRKIMERHGGLAGAPPARRYRKRFVVQDRLGGGMPCLRELIQSQTCPIDQQCSLYKWRKSEWSSCVLASGSDLVSDENNTCIGLMTRVVTCYRFTPTIRQIASSTHCLKNDTVVPSTARTCRVKCNRRSSLTGWQKKVGCLATVLPLMTTATVGDTVTPPSGEFTLVPPSLTARPVGPWSSCFIDSSDLQDPNDCLVAEMARPDGRSNGSLICGGGKHKRALGCFDDAGSVYPISYCNYQAYYEESCQIPCSVDCSMSGWTRWGRCGDILQGQTTPDVSRYLPCGENNKVRYKIRMEKPEHGGRPCPNVDSHGQVYEVRPCHTECEEKFWWATNWNTCQIKRRIGVQTQTVMCFQTWRTSGLLDTAKPEGDERLCDLETRPFGSRKCTPPPPGTCVFSEWSPWRPCTLKSGILSGAPGTCEEATRTRSRMILRSPAQSDACEGYNLTEKENCEENFNCHTYSAEWTQWSSCMLPRGAKCGVGYIKRRSNCIRSDGLPVYAGKCKSLNITLPRWQSSQCRVACQVDCRVSDWSVWSSCSSSCGLNRIRTRQRQILRLSSSSGRPCPTDLHQVRPCCAKPCYEWKLLGWGQCQVGEGNCGVGVQQRIVVCRQQDGIEIDRQQCILHQSISDGGNGRVEDKFSEEQLLQICHVPCPGECIMTSWSSWSDCHGNCDSSLPPEAYGRKTRSRVNYVVGGIEGANCNKYEIEESICSDPVCITYNWETGPFINGTRQVWCSRSDDGSKVSSGCPHHSKPSLTSDPPACSQDCDSIPHSSCTSVGACECISPYRPYNEGRTLIRCIEPTKENPKTAQYDLEWARNEVDVEATPSYSNSSSFTVADVEIEDWNLLSPVEEDGSLKIWAYIAIAVLFIVVIFIIAVVYLSYVACRRRERYKPDSDRRRRGRTNSSNNNVGVGMVVNSSGGSSVYDTRGNGYPPYFVSPVKPSPNPRYVSVRAFSRTSSTRSGYTFPDRYDSDID